MDCFEYGDVPPPPHPSKNFTYTITHVAVITTVPHILANAVVNFYGAGITETKRDKYVIKVDTKVGCLRCTMRVQVYKCAANGYVVEFMRWGGAPMAFCAKVRECCGFLNRYFHLVNAPCLVPIVIPLPPEASD